MIAAGAIQVRSTVHEQRCTENVLCMQASLQAVTTLSKANCSGRLCCVQFKEPKTTNLWKSLDTSSKMPSRPEVCDNLNKNKGELPVIGKIAPMTVRAALAELCGAASGRSGVSNIIGSINQPTNFINRPTFNSSLRCHHPMI